MFSLKTFFFGYPLKYGAYAFIGLELTIGILSALQVFFLPTVINYPYSYKYIILADIVMSFVRIVTATLGLHGIKMEKLCYITCYIIVQFMVVMIDIFCPPIRIFFSIVITSQMSYALVVTASYHQEVHKIKTRARKNASEVPQNAQVV